jgi:hypothetical protein
MVKTKTSPRGNKENGYLLLDILFAILILAGAFTISLAAISNVLHVTAMTKERLYTILTQSNSYITERRINFTHIPEDEEQ